MINSSSLCNPQLNPTSRRLVIKWRSSNNTSNNWSHQSSHQRWVRWTFKNYHQIRRIHQILKNLPICSRITVELQHWTGEILQKLVACGLSNIRSAHQNSMNYSSRQKSKDTLLWVSINFTKTSRYVSMSRLDSYKTFFLLTIP